MTNSKSASKKNSRFLWLRKNKRIVKILIRFKNTIRGNREYKYFWTISIVSLIIVIGLWMWNWKALDSYSNDVRGTHGDMFGAVNAIFSGLAFAGIIISLYLQRIDLKTQHREIQQTNREFKIQNDTLQIQKFESQYYKMIDLHKSNVNEISIPFFDLLDGPVSSKDNKKIVLHSSNTILREVTGKKGFVDMAKELEVCLTDSLCILNSEELNFNDKDIIEFAYRIFFWGVHSDFATYDNLLIYPELQERVKGLIKRRQKQYKDNIISSTQQQINTRYVPFQGHESRLAHYYRHLFQTVKYVVQQEEKELITYEESRQYLRVLRAQLSNAEQLMLYYNYICGFGKNWDRLGGKYQFLTRYRMIHNIPINRLKIVENPRVHFNKYIVENCSPNDSLFEWGDQE